MKIIIQIILLLLFVIITPLFCIAQRNIENKIKPQWIYKLPKQTNSTFFYVIKTASAETLDKAREKCLGEVISHSGLKNGVVAISESQSNENVSQIFNNGRLSERVEYDSKTSIRTKIDAVKLYVENIDEYWEKDKIGHYYLTKLYAISQMEQTPLFDDVVLSSKYGINGLWRSMIVPGWGQFHKGAKVKGGLILGGTVAFAVGIILTESQRSDYMSKITQTQNANNIRTYKTKADNMATARNICIGGVAALYVYNLIDAVVSPGAKRVIVRKNNKFMERVALAPVLSNEINGIHLSFNF